MAKPPVPPPQAKIACTALRREYDGYLRRQRGLRDKTIASCSYYAERTKEKALSRIIAPDTKPGRYRPDDKLLAFLEAL
jgi:hypothetical protein